MHALLTLKRFYLFSNAIINFFSRVAEYIPPRPLFPKRTDGAQRVKYYILRPIT